LRAHDVSQASIQRDSILSVAISLVERGLIPDIITRSAIKRLIEQRLKQDAENTTVEGKAQFIEEMSRSQLAENTSDANHQHYEVPTAFFKLMLGSHLKYSCALFETESDDLSTAEETMLALSCERAELQDQQSILELGCGWGSLTLFMAKHYPGATITAVSNSTTQREFIEDAALQRGLSNIEVITADMNDFAIDKQFDRVVSIEMFEHMRNHKTLFDRIDNWLKPTGKLFFHIFCHRNMPYFFEPKSDDDWMAKHFFTGGVMPSFDLPQHFETLALKQINAWQVNGMNYAYTCQAWLNNLDNARQAAMEALQASGNPESVTVQLNRWRMFVMACQELFAYSGGDEWFVGHYLFAKSEPTDNH